MDYQLIAYVVGACVLVYLGIRFGVPYIRGYKLRVDFEELLQDLEQISLLIGNDKADEVTVKVFSILINTYDYVTTILNDGDFVDYDKMLDFVYDQFTIIGVKVGDKERTFIDIACDLIERFVTEGR